MKVLQLEGESAQLRQVAKACAAGDISREDYRHIRAAIIDAYVLDNNVATLVADHAPPARAASQARAMAQTGDAGWSLLAIVGAGAMLVIVAMLAILLA